MAAFQDRAFLKLCADLASYLSISIASARRRVEVVANREGVKDLESRKVIAKNLLNQAMSDSKSKDGWSASEFDNLLEALAEEDNFMVED